MILTLIAPSTRVPIGGVAMIYEYANVLADRGHTIHLHHHALRDTAFESLDEITWFEFSPGIIHHFSGHGPANVDEIPSADIFFGYDDTLPTRLGLPVMTVQGWQMLGSDQEHYVYEAPCPKICVASWLVGIGRELGIPDRQLVHVPLGLHHDVFRVAEPVEDRSPRISFLHSAHPQKGAGLALDVVRRVRERRADVEVSSFGGVDLPAEFPSWIDHHTDPSRRELVDEIYNRSSIFLCTSRVEGFGFPAVEAMACGAALVTTDNGGSRDYAFHGDTALVSAPDDTEEMIDNVVALLGDDHRRRRLALAGGEQARTFRWDRTGALLEEFFTRYLDDPAGLLGSPDDRRAFSGRRQRDYAEPPASEA